MKIEKPAVQFDREKLLEAVYFVCSVSDPSKLSNVKLHKILYFSDMMRFLETGRPITGVEYIKQKMGPTARHLAWAFRELQSCGALKVSKEEFHGFIKKRYETKEDYPIRKMSAEEKDMLKEATDYFSDMSARETSEISHNAAWRSARMGEVIPYHSVYRLLPVELDDDDMKWAEKEAEIHALA